MFLVFCPVSRKLKQAKEGQHHLNLRSLKIANDCVRKEPYPRILPPNIRIRGSLHEISVFADLATKYPYPRILPQNIRTRGY